jgi:phospholipase/lecithinase/hemolysin
MKKALVRKIRLVLFIALVIGLPAAAAASQYTHIVVFGDSLSDDGNLFALDATQVPASQYYQGRFSNGLVWVEYLAGADLLDATLVNNAYGGATTDGSSPPGVQLQVSTYVASATALPDALYIIWVGANDFLGIPPADFETSAANIGDALDELATFGANHIMVVNLPDLGAIPRNAGTNNAAVATALTTSFNAELAEVVTAFETANPSIRVYEFNANALFSDVMANPADYGIGNATGICPNFTVDDDFDNDGDYLFWDSIHPTTEAHEEIAQEAAQLLPDADGDSDSSNGVGCFIQGLLKNS